MNVLFEICRGRPPISLRILLNVQSLQLFRTVWRVANIARSSSRLIPAVRCFFFIQTCILKQIVYLSRLSYQKYIIFLIIYHCSACTLSQLHRQQRECRQQQY